LTARRALSWVPHTRPESPTHTRQGFAKIAAERRGWVERGQLARKWAKAHFELRLIFRVGRRTGGAEDKKSALVVVTAEQVGDFVRLTRIEDRAGGFGQKPGRSIDYD
jgi:hypothetical protein